MRESVRRVIWLRVMIRDAGVMGLSGLFEHIFSRAM